MKRVTLIAVIGMLLIASMLAFARTTLSPGESSRPGPEQMAKMADRFLDPNDDLGGLRPTKEQRNRLIKIVMDLDHQLLPLKLELGKQRIELGQLLLESNPDKQAVIGKLQKILHIEGQKQQQMASAYFEIVKVLTPVQREAFTHFVVRRITGQGIGPELMRRFDR